MRLAGTTHVHFIAGKVIQEKATHWRDLIGSWLFTGAEGYIQQNIQKKKTVQLRQA